MDCALLAVLAEVFGAKLGQVNIGKLAEWPQSKIHVSVPEVLTIGRCLSLWPMLAPTFGEEFCQVSQPLHPLTATFWVEAISSRLANARGSAPQGLPGSWQTFGLAECAAASRWQQHTMGGGKEHGRKLGKPREDKVLGTAQKMAPNGFGERHTREIALAPIWEGTANSKSNGRQEEDNTR